MMQFSYVEKSSKSPRFVMMQLKLLVVLSFLFLLKAFSIHSVHRGNDLRRNRLIRKSSSQYHKNIQNNDNKIDTSTINNYMSSNSDNNDLTLGAPRLRPDSGTYISSNGVKVECNVENIESNDIQSIINAMINR